jgi:hypothetical protein
MTSRRTFILGTCGAGLGLAVAGCGGGASAPAQAYSGEFRTTALAAALENQAIAVYRTLLEAAHAGKLRPVTPAFLSLARTCLEQHAQHAQAWNAVLRAAHRPAVTGIPLADHSSVQREVTSVVTVAGAAGLAYRLERQAAQTFALAAGTLASRAGLAAAASIAPVEAMHAAVLAFLAGADPAHAAFGGTGAAVLVSQLTA